LNRSYEGRYKIFIGLFVLSGLVLLFRLFSIQILNTSYKESAEKNVLRYIYEYPARGLIYDRNAELLVFNDATYDLMIIPRYIQEFDTISFCMLIGMEKDTYIKKLQKAKNYSRFLPSILIPHLSQEMYSALQEQMYLYPGHFIQTRSVRKYPKPIAAHTLGYISEVTPEIIEKSPYYKPGDYIGFSGVEKSYEEHLRGRKGLRIIMVDVHNREMGSYENGTFDSIPVPGEDLYLSLDADLQAYGEMLMQNKRGGVVAIEPATGEILACITSPTYDPNLFVGSDRGNNYMKLLEDTENNPLFNRAIMTRYPPGSTFKIVSGMAAMEEGIITENTAYGCGGGYNMGSHTIACHGHPSPLRLRESIAYSCNTYFCLVFKHFVDNQKFTSSAEGYERWREYINSLGFGVTVGTDFPNELAGFIPTADYYNQHLNRKKWRANAIMSVSIGQGEVGATPLQLANLAVIIANRGWYIPPHIVRAIGAPDKSNPNYKNRINTLISPETCEVFAEGMRMVVTMGTARNAAIDGIEVCGKTGTAQDPPRKNHSVFIAFAPFKDPKIAIAVLVENSGFGSEWAAPIASLMIEKYLTGEVKRTDQEQYISGTTLLNKYQ
jgi:penicillin-binding protein 2